MKRAKAVLLTDTLVRNAKPGEKAYFLWDEAQPGFGLRVMPTGFKAFYVQYRIGGTRDTTANKLKLGTPSTIRTSEARKKASVARGFAAEGKDPAKERRNVRTSPTVADLIDLYEEQGCYCRSGERKGEPFGEKTKRFTLARLRNHVLPVLGGRRIVRLDKGDVRVLYDRVSQGSAERHDRKDDPDAEVEKKTGASGGIGIARKVLRDFSSVCSFAIEEKLMTSNPVKEAGITTNDKERKDYLTETQLMRLGRALEEAEQFHGVNPMALNQIRLWLLTGLRRDEGARLRWEEVDFDKNQIMLLKSKSIPQRPLTPPAVELLQRLRLLAELDGDGMPISPWVFPSSRGAGPYTGMKRYLPLLKRLANLKNLYPHLLRHTLGSNAVSSGLSLHLTGAILGHKNPRSTLIYAHVQDKAALDAAVPVSARIAAALDPSRSGHRHSKPTEGPALACRSWSEQFVPRPPSGSDVGDAPKEREA
ncbi:tyrosine-type recombinase/integrase [Methylobacterium fujisawaense]|uniref:tyrosine-type recombinase/integrase n=1 Tax=Methylobacterium fujisawaense TaxID=107400 RepID=UPI00313C335A